jgi:predicted HTH transcriptional regulator
MDLLETYEQLGTHEIEEYIRLEQEEHLHLEFKTVENSDLSKRDDRKNLAICVSGFANSDGGLIIWGWTREKANKRSTAPRRPKKSTQSSSSSPS